MNKWKENKQTTWQKMLDSIVFSFYVKKYFLLIFFFQFYKVHTSVLKYYKVDKSGTLWNFCWRHPKTSDVTLNVYIDL